MIDVLIAGGGPAGLATALHSSRLGLEVVVIEPRPGPIDKACGEGLMPAGLRQLEQLVPLPDGQPLRGIRYLDPRRAVTADFRSGVGRGIRRTVLHDCLLAASERAGVPVVAGRVAAVRQFDDHVEAGGLRARYLVAADGLHSPVRGAVGLEPPARRTPGRPRSSAAVRRWGIRQHFAVEPWSEHVEVYWAADCEAYVTPVAGDSVGVAVLTSHRGSFAQQLTHFPALRERLGPADPRSPVRAAGPLRQRVPRRVGGRVLLVGDAAGYVDALTGEGLSLAFASAAALAGALRADRPADYEQSWRRLARRQFALTRLLLAAASHRVSRAGIVPLAVASPRLFGRVVDELAG